MNIRRLVAPSLTLVLLIAVGAGVWHSNARLQRGERAAASTNRQLEAPKALRVRGLIGSEKEPYFADPRVQAALATHGLEVEVSKAGSREIGQRYDAVNYDFGFPSGSPSAAQLRTRAKASHTYTPFYTPMVIASWRPIAEILLKNGVVKRDGEFYYIIDLALLLDLTQRGVRWNELKDNTTFQTGKSVLINSTDVRKSNSAAMYLALASYVVNRQQVVQSQAEIDAIMPTIAPLFLRQGFQEDSSAGPFEDYLALGMGKAPLLFAYESQLVELWLQHPDKLKTEMVTLYPQPTVYSKHVLVPYTPAGEKLGAALESDPVLRQLAHEHGFRTGGDDKGPETWSTHGIKTPSVLVDVIDPPSYEWLERMIQTIEARYQ